ncbi:polysaccharide deacetylase family protein, partial [Thioalkalivibrio denitrificans]|uniref:polysaccharide deacetylase family protein n=1 Tax=Thioalkalivibrio denitrificans TaxID=108003 RepID=UPI001FE2A739
MAANLLRPMVSFLSPQGPRARLSILIYHRVLPEADPLLPGEIDADTFRWHLDLVRRLFTPLSLVEALDGLKAGRLPSRPVCITFDDGYEDNASVALPLLRDAGIPATFFVATDYLDGGMMFNDRVIESVRRLPAGIHDLDDLSLGRYELNGPESRVACYSAIIRRIKYLPLPEREQISRRLAERVDGLLPTDLMMRREQVRSLSQAGMEIGGHTASHPILTRVDDTTALNEIRRGRETLEEILERPVRFFAYPNGKPGQDYDAGHVSMVREAGFEA